MTDNLYMKNNCLEEGNFNLKMENVLNAYFKDMSSIHKIFDKKYSDFSCVVGDIVSESLSDAVNRVKDRYTAEIYKIYTSEFKKDMCDKFDKALKND
jgi:hypothetical protein